MRIHYQHGREVLNIIHGCNEPFCIPVHMPQHLGSMIIEYQNHMVWRLIDNIVSHTSW